MRHHKMRNGMMSAGLLGLAGLAVVVSTPGMAQQDRSPGLTEGGERDRAGAARRYGTVDELLLALERADDDIENFQAKLVYDKRFELLGDQHVRFGSLYFRVLPRPATDHLHPAKRVFAIHFDQLMIDGALREDASAWIFDGEWLIEKGFADKQYVARQIARPGDPIDPLRLGEGPLPIPIGQDRAEILARYQAEFLESTAGIGEDMEPYRQSVDGSYQLRLVPHEWRQRDDRFVEIRLWYAMDTLHPTLARAVNHGGDVAIVQLSDVRVNDSSFPMQKLSVQPPAEGSGWDIRVEEGRFEPVEQDSMLPPALIDPAPCCGGVVRTFAQEQSPEVVRHGGGGAETPGLAEGVLRAIEAPYLSDEERMALRVFHGVWDEGDLAGTENRARAALIAGIFDDPSLLLPEAPIEDRAEAAVRRGALQSALEMLAGQSSLRAMRLRAEALEELGRFEEADAAIDPVVQTLSRQVRSAPELVEGVRALAIRARLQGRPGSDYQHMMTLLARAHQDLDRLYWPAMLLEAELLIERDNRSEGYSAIQQVLAMNPTSAEAWALLGRMAVLGFNFEGAEAAADKLNALERRFEPESRRTHPMADMILARAWLRQDDPEYAMGFMDRVIERYPQMRRALALRCAVQSVFYDFEKLDGMLAEFDTLSPGSPEALMEVGSALSEDRQYDHAARYLEQALALQPNWSEPHIELGLLEMQSGRDARAETALERAVQLDPFNVRARNSLKLIQELRTYGTVESEHFIVRYQPGPDEVMAREMLDPLEQIHADVAPMFGHEPDRRTVIELMPNHEWFAVRITGMPAIHTMAACTGPLIAMEAPKTGKRHTGEYDWERVLRHEYTHTITLSLTENRIPHWFTEAAAVYAEQAPRPAGWAQMLAGALRQGELFDMRKINIAFVRPEKPTDRSQAYAQGHWMYEFMVERWGADAPLELMALYAAGYREDDAMCTVLELSQDEFFEAFKAWAWHEARAWGLAPEVTTREMALRDLMADEQERERISESLDEFASASAMAITTGVSSFAWQDQIKPLTFDAVERWLETYPDHPDLLQQYVSDLVHFAGGEPLPEHIPLLERYADARPVDPMPHRHLARLYLASDDPNRAIPHLEYLDARETHSSAYAIALARRYASLQQWDRAMRKAERATQIAPFDAGHRELAATMAIQASRLDIARRHLLALVDLEPTRDVHRKRLEALDQRMQVMGAG